MSNDYDPFFSWKALRWSRECEQIARGGMPWPVQATIYPTNRCNRNCRFCIMRQERTDGAELPRKVWEELLCDLMAGGTRCLHIAGGGEPLLYPHLDALREVLLTKVLSTNGTRLDRDVCSWFTRIRVSVNAGTAKGYGDVTGCTEADWRDLCARLRDCCRKPRRWQIGLGMVADHQTVNEIRPLCKLADEVGADFVHIRPAYYPAGTVEAYAVEGAWGAIATAAQRAREASNCRIHAIDEKFRGHWTPRGYEQCRATPLVAVICADGRLAVCQDVFIKFGDLHSMRFPGIWQSDEHREALAKIDLDSCPRCIMARHNEVIEHCFCNSNCMMELL